MRARKKRWGTAKCGDVDRKDICERGQKRWQERRREIVPSTEAQEWTLQ